MIKLEKIYLQVREIILADISGSLLKFRKKDLNFPTKGYCYIASEAIFHLIPNCKSFYIKHENDSHWFLKYKNQIIDPTFDQFNILPNYNNAIGKGFLTKSPSKRTQLIINKIK